MTGTNDTPNRGGASNTAHAARTARIRALNDQLRQTFTGGQVVITSSLDALPMADRLDLFARVKSFTAFTPDNDPDGEHDFGSFTFGGATYFWKIDCYDLDRLGHSPDPTDPAVTQRVLTIFRAEEY
jgi:hypothetical protein